MRDVIGCGMGCGGVVVEWEWHVCVCACACACDHACARVYSLGMSSSANDLHLKAVREGVLQLLTALSLHCVPGVTKNNKNVHSGHIAVSTMITSKRFFLASAIFFFQKGFIWSLQTHSNNDPCKWV